MLSNVRISRKLGILLALAGLCCILIAGFGLASLRHAIHAERAALLVAEIDTAASILKMQSARVASGEITEEAAKREAASVLGAIRFGQDDYLFVTDEQARMIVHPNAKLIGQSLWEKADSTGFLLFQSLVAEAKKGGGFTPYLWPRAGSDIELPKLSYSKLMPEWGWVLGTGMYMDDVGATVWRAGVETTLWVCGALVVLLIGALLITREITRPLKMLTSRMTTLAEGQLKDEVPHASRGDEIGVMARAVQVFRDAGIEKVQLASQAEEARRSQAESAERQSALNEAKAEDLRAFVHQVEAGFARLVAGDLTARMDQAVAPEFEPIRAQFNSAVAQLEDTIGQVVGAVGAMRSGLSEITVAAGDLSQRTEQQAASLEETVAALGEVTRGVADTAQRADAARQSASVACREAERGGEVVARAVSAMSEIEQSSQKIGNIIGVIDEIAFQTNLLALNAGVEAARAGEAGRGFAVVAQEVRGLAQRSAEAAKEIKALIQASGDQVASGVELVSASGRSLEAIVTQVGGVAHAIAEMADAAREQAVSLREVSTAADQMDKVTQQNAAMVEETTAAANTLSAETEQVAQLVGTFALGGTRQAPTARASGPGRRPAAASPARPVAQMRTVGRGGAAAKPAAAAAEDNWEEF